MSYRYCEDEVIGVWGGSPSTGSRGGIPGGGQGTKPRKSGSREGVPAKFGAEPQEEGVGGVPPPIASNLKRLTKNNS